MIFRQLHKRMLPFPHSVHKAWGHLVLYAETALHIDEVGIHVHIFQTILFFGVPSGFSASFFPFLGWDPPSTEDWESPSTVGWDPSSDSSSDCAEREEDDGGPSIYASLN